MGKKFLATTALSDFWDVSGKIIFLGEWCCLYKDMNYLKTLDYSILESPLRENENFCKFLNSVTELYERLIPVFSQVLNFIHKVNYSDRYWRIIIGFWLLSFIEVLSDKYLHLRIAIDEFSPIYTIGMHRDDYVILMRGSELYSYAQQDLYNLQLISRLAQYMGIPIEYHQLKEKGKFEFHSNLINLALSIKKEMMFINSALRKPFHCKKNGYSVFIVESLFKRQAIHRLMKEYHFIHEIRSKRQNRKKYHPNHTMRSNFIKSLKKNFTPRNEFEDLFISVIEHEIPFTYLEGYVDTIQLSQKIFDWSDKPCIIFTANAFWGNDLFIFWAANQSENGSLILCEQHGGNYGSLKMLNMEQELKIADIFYTWGWSLSTSDKFRIRSATRLVDYGTYSDTNRDGLLYGITSFSRYIYGTNYILNNYTYNKYLEMQLQFLHSLTPEMRERMGVRCYLHDYGWGEKSRILDEFPTLKIEGWNLSFEKRLEKTRLYICDHLSTTFIESLYSGTPTIIFWDRCFNDYYPEAEEYYDELNKAGILYYSAEEAAEVINIHYDDIEMWWQNEERQRVKNTFIKRFGFVSDDPIQEWGEEFMQLISKI